MPYLRTLFILFFIVSAGITHAENIFDMADRMDKSDFADAIDNARSCASSNNFSCSESSLSKARKLAHNKKQKQQLADAKNYLTSQKRTYEEERRRTEQRRLAEQRERERQQAAASSSYGSSANTPSPSNTSSSAPTKGVKRIYNEGKYTYIECNNGDKGWVYRVGGGKCTNSHTFGTNDCQYEIDSFVRHCEK